VFVLLNAIDIRTVSGPGKAYGGGHKTQKEEQPRLGGKQDYPAHN